MRVRAIGVNSLEAVIRSGVLMPMPFPYTPGEDAAVQIARAAGFRVLGTASSERGQALVKQAGAHQVFNHSDPKYVQQIAEATNGKGIDLILEMKGDVNLGKDVELVAANGRIVVIGGKQVGAGGAGVVEINPYTLLFRNASILGCETVI